MSRGCRAITARTYYDALLESWLLTPWFQENVLYIQSITCVSASTCRFPEPGPALARAPESPVVNCVCADSPWGTGFLLSCFCKRYQL